MKYIIDLYGRFLLSGAVLLLVFVLLFSRISDSEGNRGAFKIMGAALGLTNESGGAGIDFAVYRTESEKEAPSIVYSYDGKLYANEAVLLSDFIRAVDYNSGPLELRVLQVTDSASNDITSCYDRRNGNICFPAEGMNRITLAVKDSSNKKYTCTIEVPVNRR